MSELKNLEIKLRYLERTFNEIQKLRKSASNRIGSYVRNGYTDEKTAEEMHNWVDDTLLDAEKKVSKQIEEVVVQHPLWHEWFAKVRGVGKLLAGQLMGEINIEKTPHPSALWAYAGLATQRWCPICGYETFDDIKLCPKCGNELQGKAVERKYGRKYNANIQLKTIVYKIIDISCWRQGGFYKDFAEEVKRYETIKNQPFKINIEHATGYVLAENLGKIKMGTKIKSKGSDKNIHLIKKELEKLKRDWVLVVRSKQHIHLRATRVARKLFLSHTWEMWRRIRGLPVTEPYAIKILGHEHYISPEQVIKYDEMVRLKKKPKKIKFTGKELEGVGGD